MNAFNRRYIDAAFLASARWHQGLVESVSAIFGLEAQIRLSRETLNVRNVEATFALPREPVGAFAGLAWEPF